jgi:hypothetical protein
MMSALVILVIWLAFDIAIGIPIWMLLKFVIVEKNVVPISSLFSNTSRTLKRENVSRPETYPG